MAGRGPVLFSVIMEAGAGLADYLSVGRSAMSNELYRLRDEGVLEFEKNRFKLKGQISGR